MMTIEERKVMMETIRNNLHKRIERYWELKKEGHSIREIAMELGINESTCRHMIRMADKEHENQDVT